MRLLPIFKEGSHVDSSGMSHSFSRERLRDIVASYDPTTYNAPLILGHAEQDQPRFGGVKFLVEDGGILYAAPEAVNPEFGAWVNQGLYDKISIKFFPEDHPHNPKPGHPYLCHVGFFGACPVAVAGLPAPKFAAADKLVGLEFTVADGAVQFGVMDTAQAQLAQERRTLQEERNQFEAQKGRAAHLKFVDELVAVGKVLPRHRDGLIAMMAALPSTSIQFSAVDGTTKKEGLLEFARGYLADQPVIVPVRKQAGDGKQSPKTQEFAAIEVPMGWGVDPAAQALYVKAQEYCAAHEGVSFVEAYKAVGGK